MPQYISGKLHIPTTLLSARVLFPFGLSFFIPLFVYTLTMEKQSRILIMMKVIPFRFKLTSDERIENMDLLPGSLHRFPHMCTVLNDNLSHRRRCFSSGTRLH
jgi:hypothetical protein